VSFGGRKIILRFYDTKATHAGLSLSFSEIRNEFAPEKAKNDFLS
jgi:hypothetical protein